jgi:hypothetical protein
MTSKNTRRYISLRIFHSEFFRNNKAIPPRNLLRGGIALLFRDLALGSCHRNFQIGFLFVTAADPPALELTLTAVASDPSPVIVQL